MPESRGQFLGGSAMSPVASVVGPRGDRGSEMPNFRPKANLCGFRPDGRQTGNYPETGFREMSVSGVGTIEAHLLEADFWGVSEISFVRLQTCRRA